MIFIECFLGFTCFTCKLLLAGALRSFGGAARRCMIDNTRLVVLRGTGREMVPVLEMAAFAERYGFPFAAHEKRTRTAQPASSAPSTPSRTTSSPAGSSGTSTI